MTGGGRTTNGLRRSPGFGPFWAAATVSSFSTSSRRWPSRCSWCSRRTAEPPRSVWFSAARWLPYLLFGVFADVFVDRTRRRPLLVATDFARAVLLVAIPTLAVVDHLSLVILMSFLIVFGSASLVKDAASQSFLPRLGPGSTRATPSSRPGHHPVPARSPGRHSTRDRLKIAAGAGRPRGVTRRHAPGGHGAVRGAITLGNIVLLLVRRGSLDRRQVLRLGVLTATAVGTSTVVSRMVAAGAATTDDGTVFDEVFAGRQVRGRLERRGAQLVPAVYIDGVELHLMRSGSSFTTSVNHYQTYATPRRAARAAVVSLNGAQLLPMHS
jgi:hypothetical protein